MAKWLKRVAVVSLVLSPFVYLFAGVIVIARQRLQLSGATLGRVVLGEDSSVFWFLTALPLLGTCAVIWLLSLHAARQPVTEQRARVFGSLAAFFAVFAFSLAFAEEGLAAPILHLRGASTSALAFVFMPPYAAILLGLAFGIVWSLTHLFAHIVRRRAPALPN